MKEQSHKREMAAAVRGDFARLRQRGVVPTIGTADRAPSGRAVERSAGAVGEAPVRSEPAAASPSRTLLGRLLGRS